MLDQYNKLVSLLKELFQTDQADLDFGIYRIMNQRRKEINCFLEEDLLSQVKTSFEQFQQVDKKVFDAKIEEAKGAAIEAGYSEEEAEQAPKVKKLKEEKANYSVDIDETENQVYNDLYQFFRRYYDDGDFISQRRYKDGVYAIPYEGEEVKLYWANYDQYYIKTSEYLRDYTFKLPSGKKVHFKLVEADTENDNRKEDNEKKRVFILAEDAIHVENGEVQICFEFRADEEKRTQKQLNEITTQAIFDARASIDDPNGKDVLAELATFAPTESDKNRTLLAKHLEDYTRRNTQDYFIHKDLGKFLRRELDFYIKNEIMRLDDIEEAGVPKVEQYLSRVKVLRQIAHKTIDFLAQIEDFQKKLWLKKKFVVETNYCITLDRIPEELYPEIAANEAQREEWVRLFAIDEIKPSYGNLLEKGNTGYSVPLTVEFLKDSPFLVLDTKFFRNDFKLKLLQHFVNLDKELEGLLILGENFQTINLFLEKYSNKIKCVHIDPPYNTQTSGFLYKNNYYHSSWLSMMENRIGFSNILISENGSFLCHIDDVEYENLYSLFEIFSLPDAGTIVWDKRNPMNAGRGIARQHEYIIWRSSQETPIYLRSKNYGDMLKKANNIIKKYGKGTEIAQKEFASWINSNSKLSGGEKAYRYLDEQGRIYQSFSLRAPEPITDPKFHMPLIHPITGKPCALPPNGFSRTPETLASMVEKGEIIFGEDETIQPRQKVLLTNETKRQITSVISDGRKGKADLTCLGLDFPYCHPTSLYEKLIGTVVEKKGDIVIDYFAGSGTTAHAVIDLNREDDGRRKYILVEMGEYFDTILKPRIEKVIYSADWKDGKPVSRQGSSHAFKYMKLESYEDTLNNLRLKRSEDQNTSLLGNETFKEDYMLHYMLDVEAKESLLDLKNFETPFDYQLNIASSTVGETIPTKVDLVETFNYLIGLWVKSIKRISDCVLVEGSNKQDGRVLVIWRDLRKVDNKKLEYLFREWKIVEREDAPEVIYINGDNSLMKLREEEQTWRVKLIEEEFHRRMFED